MTEDQCSTIERCRVLCMDAARIPNPELAYEAAIDLERLLDEEWLRASKEALATSWSVSTPAAATYLRCVRCHKVYAYRETHPRCPRCRCPESTVDTMGAEEAKRILASEAEDHRVGPLLQTASDPMPLPGHRIMADPESDV